MRVAWAGSCWRSSATFRPGSSVRASKTTRCSGPCQRWARSCARIAGRAARADAWSVPEGSNADGLVQRARRILDSRSNGSGTERKELLGSTELGSPILRWRLCCAGNHGPHESDAVDGYCDSVHWRCFARDLRAAKSFCTGTDQDGRAPLSLRRKRKSKFQTRAGLDGNIGVKENPGTGDIAQLAGVILQRAVLRHTDLYRQVNLVASGLSALSHNIPPDLDARRRPGDFRAATLKKQHLRVAEDSQVGKGNANSSHSRKYRHALMKLAGAEMDRLAR